MSTYQGMTERQMWVLSNSNNIRLVSDRRWAEIETILAGGWGRIDRKERLVPTVKGRLALKRAINSGFDPEEYVNPEWIKP